MPKPETRSFKSTCISLEAEVRERSGSYVHTATASTQTTGAALKKDSSKFI